MGAIAVLRRTDAWLRPRDVARIPVIVTVAAVILSSAFLTAGLRPGSERSAAPHGYDGNVVKVVVEVGASADVRHDVRFRFARSIGRILSSGYDDRPLLARASLRADGYGHAPRSVADDLVGAACSFSAGTTVVMADGSRKAIADVEVGDYVLAEDPETGERGPRRVTHVWKHEDTVVDLEIDGDLVTTTEDHPFWNVTDGEWQQAQDLDVGDLVRTTQGDLVEVGGVRLGTARTTTAFNLTVDGIHTYFVGVGEDDVLVHNTCLGPGKWMSPDEFADDLVRNTRNRYRHLPTETGQHGAGLRAAARDIRQQAETGGYLPEIRDRLLRTAKRWEARARGIDHPGR